MAMYVYDIGKIRGKPHGLQKGTNKQSQTHPYVRFSMALICGSHAKVNIEIYLITQRLQLSSEVSSFGHYTETKKFQY